MKIKIEKALPEDAVSILEYLKIVGGETDNLTFGAEGMAISVEAEIDELAVSVKRAEWGKGIGSMLIDYIIDFAKNIAHAEIISLEVRSDNTRAIRLYEKYGFEKIGLFRGFFKINGAYVDFDLMNLYL